MKNTAIIIPSRLGAKRFPNKPLVKINGLPMIVHVMNRAKESKVGNVIVATPDNEIMEAVNKNGGQAILTQNKHLSGTDRIYEAYLKKFKNNVDLIINLQGDMPNINPSSISKLVNLTRENKCSIGTLASIIKSNDEIKDPNIVKVKVEKELKSDTFLQAKDFFRLKEIKKDEKIYHHLGIYAFTNVALKKYVELSRSNLEIERNLEQMRAMENNLLIKVGLSEYSPLGVDTQKDLKRVIERMK